MGHELGLDGLGRKSVLSPDVPYNNETLSASLLDRTASGVHRETDVDGEGAFHGSLSKYTIYSHFDKIAKAAHDARR